jgi:sugar phosphate isomerase/epimerase
MKIGISRISSTPEEALRVLEAAHRYGFEGVQLKPSQYSEFVASPQAFSERYAALSYLAGGGLIFYPGGAPSTWQDQVAPVLPFAGAIGAGHICLCSGVYESGASDEQVRETADALMQIGSEAQSQRLVVSIHNHMDSLVESEDDIARLLDIIDPAQCGLTLDTAHAAKAGILNVADLAVRFQRHLLNVHLKDIAENGEFCALGQGTLAVRPILDALTSVEYSQWLIVDEETKNLSTEETFHIASDCLRAEGLELAR